jgi:hypothetical protein
VTFSSAILSLHLDNCVSGGGWGEEGRGKRAIVLLVKMEALSILQTGPSPLVWSHSQQSKGWWRGVGRECSSP